MLIYVICKVTFRAIFQCPFGTEAGALRPPYFTFFFPVLHLFCMLSALKSLHRHAPKLMAVMGNGGGVLCM